MNTWGRVIPRDHIKIGMSPRGMWRLRTRHKLRLTDMILLIQGLLVGFLFGRMITLNRGRSRLE
jgi:hypothetical protein